MTVRAFGNEIAHDWVESVWAYDRNRSPVKPERNWKNFSRGAQAAIDNCEIVIVEASGSSCFGAGYEAAIAIQRKKPTLILIKKEVFDQSYAAGLTNDTVSIRTYDEDSLEQIVQNFLIENAKGTKELRFNFVIDRRIYNHLRRRSFQTGKTKAEVVRDLLIRDIEAS